MRVASRMGEGHRSHSRYARECLAGRHLAGGARAGIGQLARGAAAGGGLGPGALVGLRVGTVVGGSVAGGAAPHSVRMTCVMAEGTEGRLGMRQG